jgi:hypothetical protein
MLPTLRTVPVQTFLGRWLSSGLLRRAIWLTFTDVSEVLAASIIRALMMEAASTSEKSVNFNQTTLRNNPEDSHLHTRRRENLKFHRIYSSFRNGSRVPAPSSNMNRIKYRLMWSIEWIHTNHKNGTKMSMVVFWVVTPCGLTMEAVCSSETLVPTYKSTRHHNPQDHHGNLHRRENLKSLIGNKNTEGTK